jgi:hypothetical protein
MTPECEAQVNPVKIDFYCDRKVRNLVKNTQSAHGFANFDKPFIAIHLS